MNWQEVVSDLEKRVSAQRSKVAQSQAELLRAQTELERLERNFEAVLDLRDEYQKGGLSNGTKSKAVADRGFDWTALTRNAAIRALLRTSDKPLMPKDIAAILKQHGRESDTPNLVSAALANMRQRGKVIRTQKGWTSPDREPPGDPRVGDLLGVARPEGSRV